ncbi:hypothetical protein EDB86DRAFT_2831930 [Lactarius hatsudake]|nr:hypothetical protein EDB86DRAFT_2831930 [Lactarius hatsudake]
MYALCSLSSCSFRLYSTTSFCSDTHITDPAPSGESTNYGAAHGSGLSKQKIVSRKSFDRLIQATFYDLAKQGTLLDRLHALTHPSEPNHMAVAGGDFWGCGDENLYHISSKRVTYHISIILDLLEAKDISWASYQENLPSDGFEGVNFFSTNYLKTRAPIYPFYAREHNPTIFYDSVASVRVPSRSALHCDFVVDANASALPQWMFVTPNMLVPLLNDTNFNDNRTLILLTFDANETYSINNRVFALLLGGAVPENVRGTVNSLLHTLLLTHHRGGKLGSRVARPRRTNKRDKLQNLDVSPADVPPTNITGTILGPLNAQSRQPHRARQVRALDRPPPQLLQDVQLFVGTARVPWCWARFMQALRRFFWFEWIAHHAQTASIRCPLVGQGFS